jgi:sorting and assembly machinery component 37
MVLELHVWGPAFSLPSVDAQCLAAIAYFTQALPKGEWVVVAASPSVSPTSKSSSGTLILRWLLMSLGR